MKTSICSTHRKGPLSGFNQNADGRRKEPKQQCPSSLGSQSQRREATENKLLLFTQVKLTMAEQVGLKSFLTACSEMVQRQPKKTRCVQKVQSAICLQTQMVPLTCNPLISLYVPWASRYKTTTWFNWERGVLKKQVLSAA